MHFSFVKLPELDFDLKSVTVEGSRKYTTPEGNSYPSVTTILSHSTDKSFLIKWRKRVGEEESNKIVKKSSGRGTKLHSVCEKYLLNELNDMKIRMMMPDIKDFFLQLRPYIDQNVQCTAYAEMFEERTGLPIEQIVVAIANEEGKPQIFIREKCNYVSKLNEYIGNYWNNA